jgi:hypothetical protein
VEAAEKKKKSGLRKQNAQKKVACLTSLRWHASTRCSGSCLKKCLCQGRLHAGFPGNTQLEARSSDGFIDKIRSAKASRLGTGTPRFSNVRFVDLRPPSNHSQPMRRANIYISACFPWCVGRCFHSYSVTGVRSGNSTQPSKPADPVQNLLPRCEGPIRPCKAASPASVWIQLLFKTSGSAKWPRDPGRRQIESLVHSQLGQSHRSQESSHIRVCRRPAKAHVAPGVLSDSTPKIASKPAQRIPLAAFAVEGSADNGGWAEARLPVLGRLGGSSTTSLCARFLSAGTVAGG